MTNHWAIAIGINQYRHFQPLTYAERDAQLFRDFLLQDAGFSPKHCLLLTDTSPAIEHTATYPSQEIIQAYIVQLCQKLQPGDFLWCFFSGYGVQFEGKDYLMPADGRPDAVSTTGIPVEFLFETFASAPTNNILLALDVNRSQSVLAGEGVGEPTIQLAHAHGMAALLSAHPDQFSHETLALRQGLFSTALIEGMRYRGCVTIDQLVQYLSDRLPELSEHHWRPRQEPLIAVPIEKKHQLLMPELSAVALSSGNLSLPKPADRVPASGLSAGGPSYKATALLERSLAMPFPDASSQAMLVPPTVLFTPRVETIVEEHVPETVPQTVPQEPQAEDAQFWRRLIRWGGAIAAILMLLVVIRNWQKLVDSPGAAQPDAVEQGAEAPSPIDPASPLGSVQIALQSGQYEEARRQLLALPAEQQNADFLKLFEYANRGLLSDARTILSRTRATSSENQASDFADAIAKARQIHMGQPLFEEAHLDIDRWSRVILDMAQGRADRRNGSSTPAAATNYSAAIFTAQLVPNDNPDIYAQAQQAIAQWSQLILELATDRATEGNYEAAIQAAEMIPKETPSYAAAQEAIGKWRQPVP